CGERKGGGFVGQITANSFMKREFGKKLIEDYFANKVELTHIIDTSGAYIPGHGTPTVILAGRNQIADQEKPIRAVLGVRGEPGAPDDPAKGLVWTTIVEQVGRPGSESAWVSVEDAVRERFASAPWSVGGGGTGELQQVVEENAPGNLGDRSQSIGITSVTGEDDLFLLPRGGCAARLKVEQTRPMVTGDVIRDYELAPDFDAIWVYGPGFETLDFDRLGLSVRILQPYRVAISQRKRFGVPMLQRGMKWHEWQEIYP